MDKFELEKEKRTLFEKSKLIKEVINDEQTDLKELYNSFAGNKDELWDLIDRKNLHINNLNASLDKPYFARIDFTSEEDAKNNSIYIGKNGVVKNTDIIVTDWRSPISSLYYDSEIGECSFSAPDGLVKGNMSLKRQYEIDNGTLLEYFDVDLVSNDGLLQKYLNSNNDARLRSIVSTIQKEQNDVIRRKITNNLIVQGVAGSGKTTVALHRIAFLVYNYINHIKQNQYLVIGPNPVFLKYIKSVLPELDVNGVEQCTYEGYAQKYINEDISINSSDKKVVASISGNNNSDVDKFKCSMKYKDMLEIFLEEYFSGVTSQPLVLDDFEVVSKDLITDIFLNSFTGHLNNLNSRIEITIDRLCIYIEKNKERILRKYSDYSYELFKTAITDDDKKNMRSQFAKTRSEIISNCRSTIRKYFNKSKVNATKLYKLFINNIENYDIYHYELLNKLKIDTLKNMKKNTYDFEDLASLIYIKSLIAPNKDYEKIKHVVIDEAQDLGEFNFYILKYTLPMATFSIFGDLAQSIYDYRGINNWEEVNRNMFNNDGEIINFNKSYRTTAEIMNVADDVAESIGTGRSDLVVRHGNKVQFTEIESDQNISEYIVRKINEYKEKGYRTIAIISKTDELSNHINNDLENYGIDIPNITSNDDLSNDKFNICTISNQLAKGLEFDAVIINNANETVYSSTNPLDMKLLYVAITRALHELDIVFDGDITKVLENQLNKSRLNN